jgi:predicted transcriptional regulator
MGTSKLTIEQTEQVIELKKAGMYNNQIAKFFNVPHWVVSYVLRQNNLKSYRKLVSHEINRIINLHAEGMNNVEIAKILCITDAAVGKILRRCNLHTNLRRIEQVGDEIIKLYNQGQSCLAISKQVGFSDANVGIFLRKNHLPLYRFIKLEIIDEIHAKCSRCRQIKELLNWPMNGKSSYYSYCRECFNTRTNKYKQRNPFKIRFYHIRKRCYKEHIPFDLTPECLMELWEKQIGLCFYTDRPMNRDIQANDPTAMSVDRIDSTGGYMKGNIVLCQRRINSMKNDATIEEMKLWMPEWYRRVHSLMSLSSL